MDRQRAKKLLPIIQAFVDGKQIQALFSGDDTWTSVDDPAWHPHYEYRVKPEPKEVWVNEYPGGQRFGYATKECADRMAVHSDRISCTRYLEALED